MIPVKTLVTIINFPDEGLRLKVTGSMQDSLVSLASPKNVNTLHLLFKCPVHSLNRCCVQLDVYNP